MATILDDKKLKHLIKESVREALAVEFMKLRALVVPEISEQEQQDVEKRYGAPTRKKSKSYSVEV